MNSKFVLMLTSSYIWFRVTGDWKQVSWIREEFEILKKEIFPFKWTVHTSHIVSDYT